MVTLFIIKCQILICAFEQRSDLSSELGTCLNVILMNARICLQQSELYPSQNPYQQLLDLYDEEICFTMGRRNKSCFLLLNGTSYLCACIQKVNTYTFSCCILRIWSWPAFPILWCTCPTNWGKRGRWLSVAGFPAHSTNCFDPLDKGALSSEPRGLKEHWFSSLLCKKRESSTGKCCLWICEILEIQVISITINCFLSLKIHIPDWIFKIEN